MSEELGIAELELGANLKPLDRDLAKAERRVAASVAAMQRMLDSLDAHAELRIGSVQALADRLAGLSLPRSAEQVLVPSRAGANQTVKDAPEVWGIRGPQHAGSLTNPIVTVLAAGKFFPMGSYGAAIGEGNEADAQRGDQASGVASAADMAALTAAVSDLASNVTPGARLATAGASNLGEPGAGQRTVVALDRQNGDALGRAASAMERTAVALARPSGAVAGASSPAAEREQLLTALRAVAALRSGSGGQPAPGRMLVTAQAAHQLGVAPSRVYYLAGSGQLPGAVKQGGAWRIPAQVVASMAAGGGYNGGVIPPIPPPGGGGGPRNQGGNPWLRKLLWGNGLWGLAGFGSLGSFAGLGPEHLLMTALGIAGSAGAGAAGGGLLGLGALGSAAVGGGSDVLAMRTAAANVKTLNTDMNNLSQAVAVYGKNSTQAAQAQKQLNYDLAGMGPAGQAALRVANQLQALDKLWTSTSAGAQLQANMIFSQVLGLATQFAPMVASAAQRNLQIVNQSLHPLFTWLRGPDGIGIFNNLENNFARNLPSAIGAFNGGLQLLLRITSIASNYTGGFTQHLDHLFARLNGLSNIQLNDWVGRLVGDFRLWEQFVKALGVDLARLFSNDVGTGSSIIRTLTVMLQKLGAWEQSVQGRQSLMTLFTVHKAEIDQLLQVLPLLVGGFAPIYMTVAPALTTAFTGVAHAIISVVKAIESIPGGTWLIGLGVIASRVGLLAPLLRRGLIGGAAGAAGGAGAGAASGAASGAAGAAMGGLLGRIAATGVGGAISGGIAEGSLSAGAGLAGLTGLDGLGTAIASAGAAVAPVAAGLLPLLAAAGGVYGLIKLFGLFSGGGGQEKRSTLNSSQLAQALQAGGVGALRQQGGTQVQTSGFRGVPGFGGGVNGTVLSIAQMGVTPAARQALNDWVATVSKSTTVSHMSAQEMQGMVREGQALARIFPQDAELIDRFINRVRADLAPLEAVWATINKRWSQDAHSGLRTLTDVFDTNTRLISHVLGLNSAQGRQAMASNVNQMVRDVTRGMLDGKISVINGMAAIRRSLSQGMKDNAVTWSDSWHAMFSTVSELYSHHKISTSQYYADLHQITSVGDKRIRQDTSAEMKGMFAYLKGQQQQGNLTHAAFLEKWHQQQTQATAQSQTDMSAFAATIVGGFATVTQQGGVGLQDLIKSVNSALKLLGAAPLTGLQVAVMGLNAGKTNQLVHQRAAQGGLFQIGRPGEAGRDSVPLDVGGTPIVVAPGEQVAVFNRHQLPIVDAALAPIGGLPGLFSSVNRPNYMAGGGMVGTIGTPGVRGGGALGTLVHAALGLVAKDANKYVGQHAPKGGGGNIGSTSGLSGSLLQIVHQLAARFGWTGQIGDWLSVINAESGGRMTAVNGSSGAYGIAQFINGPGEYAQYGGNVNTMAGQLLAMGNYIRQRYGDPAAAWAHELSAHWYARGGLLPGFASGGKPRKAGKPSAAVRAFIARARGHAGHKHKPRKPKGLVGGLAPAPGVIGEQGPFPFDSQGDWNAIDQIIGTILRVDGTSAGSGGVGGDAQRLSSLIGWYTNLWGSSLYPAPNFSSWDTPANFVISTDAQGNPVTPYLSPNLGLVTGELSQIIGLQGGVVGDLQGALWNSTAVVPAIQAAIKRRQDEVVKIRKRIVENVRRIRRLQKQIRDEQARKLPYPKARTRAQRQANVTFDRERRNRIAGYSREIAVLQKENQQLGGNPTSVGTGGELAQITAQLGAPESGGAIGQVIGTGSSASGLFDLLSTVQGWAGGLGGIGGDIAQQTLQLNEYQQGLLGLNPNAVGLIGAAAAANVGAGAGSATGANPLTGTVAFTYQGQTFLAGLGQGAGMAAGGLVGALSALGSMPPYAGSFGGGGVVPGPAGAARTAIVHGGEVIGQPAGGDMAGAIDRLIGALGDHEASVQQLTKATCANTSATVSATSAGQVRYTSGSSGRYPSVLSSDDPVTVGVGL